MAVPGLGLAVEDLDHAHAVFDEAERHQATAGEVGVAIPGASRAPLPSDVQCQRRLHLHPEGHFHGLDSRFQLRLVPDPVQVAPIEPVQEFQLAPLLVRAERGVADVADQFLRVGLVIGDVGPLVRVGQEGRGPELGTAHRIPGAEDHESGQIFILRAQSVGDPRAHGGVAGQLVTAVHEVEGRDVIAVVRVHGPDHAEVVDEAADPGEDFGHQDAALTPSPESERGLHQVAGGAVGPDLGAGHGFPVVPVQLRFGVEAVHLGEAAVEEEEDHVFGTGGEMRDSR